MGAEGLTRAEEMEGRGEERSAQDEDEEERHGLVPGAGATEREAGGGAVEPGGDQRCESTGGAQAEVERDAEGETARDAAVLGKTLIVNDGPFPWSRLAAKQQAEALTAAAEARKRAAEEAAAEAEAAAVEEQAVRTVVFETDSVEYFETFKVGLRLKAPPPPPRLTSRRYWRV